MQSNGQFEKAKFIDTANSSALQDDLGHIYYFKQKGKTRTLYKDQQAIFSFQGYYGIVVDTDSEGQIYFIASTEYGSSLFSWKNNQLLRLSTADNIIDAKILNHNQANASINWLVATIESEQFQYLRLQALTTPNFGLSNKGHINSS